MTWILFISLIFFAGSFWCFASNVKANILKAKLAPAECIQDTIIIHFTHGSVPKKGCPDQKKVQGGYFGGHIEIQTENMLYGFVNETFPVHIFPRNKFNAKFERIEFSVWSEKAKTDRITSIHLPLTAEQKKNIDSILDAYFKTTPYDYAFFGNRCASSTIGILSDAGIFKKFTATELIIAFFYPKPLKNTMIKFAQKNKLRIDFRKGSECRNWE